MRRVPATDDDAQRHQIREREDDPDDERDHDRLPGASPPEEQDHERDRHEGEDEPVEEPEQRSLRDAPVHLVADPVRPPPRHGRRRDEQPRRR
jgi:hypothetical protein